MLIRLLLKYCTSIESEPDAPAKWNIGQGNIRRKERMTSYNTSSIQVLYKYNSSIIHKKTQRKETYHNQWDEVEFVPRAAHCVIRLERETCFHQNQTTFPLSPLARPRCQCFFFVFSLVLIKVLFLFPFSFFCYILNGLNMCATQHKSSIQGNLI